MESTASQLGRKHKVAAEDILTQSWHLFELNGYDNTTMAEIADGVGLSRRSLFNYFPHKEALLFPGLSQVLDLFIVELLKRPSDENILVSIEKCMSVIDEVASSFEGMFVPTEEIVRAQTSPASVSYVREYTTGRMRDVALERYQQERHVEIKAGLVSALTAQVLAEAISLSTSTQSSQRKNVKVVLQQLSELFR